MKRPFLTLISCLAMFCSTSLLAQVRMIPHLTSPQGGFETQILAVNTASDEQTLILSPFEDDGTPHGDISRPLSGGESLWLSRSDWEVDGEFISHLRLDGTAHAIQVYAVFDFAAGVGSAAHVMETAAQGKAFRIYPGNWENVFDGVALVNMGSDATSITVRQVDASGNLVDAQEIIPSLAPGAKARFVIGGPFDERFTPQLGTSFDVVATQEIALVALRGTPPQAPVGYLWAVEPAILPDDLEINQGLSPEQRMADFDHLVSLVSKRYGPLEWKASLLGTDILGSAPAFRERIRMARNDVAFFELMFEFISQFQDGHTGFWLPSSYVASLGFQVDLFDDRLLVYEVTDTSTTLNPGDEILTMDGESASNLVERLRKYTPSGFDRVSRRWATALVTTRQQAVHPGVVSGDTELLVRRADGTEETLTLTWTTSGVPFLPGQYPDIFSKTAAIPEPRTALERLQWIAPSRQRLAFLLNSGKYGHIAPSFALPDDFNYRVGGAYDEIFSGTYVSGEKTIGLLRIPKMFFTKSGSPRAFEREIAHMKANTDGLVIDIMDNPGGQVDFCNTVASFLHTQPFSQILFQFRPDLVTILDLEQQKAFEDDPDLLAFLQYLIDEFKRVYQGPDHLTEPISLDGRATGLMMEPATDAYGQPLGYDKPIIVLINDLSISGGDFLPAVLQDNGRAKLVGYRTAGGGGHVASYEGSMLYSESSVSLTGSLMVRAADTEPQGYPASPYIENVGVHPDVLYDYQNADDLMHDGQTFFAFFTDLILQEIDAAEATSL